MLMHAISSPRAQSLTASPAHPGPEEAAASSQGLNISKDRIRQTPRTCDAGSCSYNHHIQGEMQAVGKINNEVPPKAKFVEGEQL